MNYPCPNHIDGYVKKLEDTNKFIHYELGEYNIPFIVQCSCGSEEFKIYKDDRPYVDVKCIKCDKIIVVYNLSIYPAAADIDTNEPMNEVISKDGDDLFNVCVIYEYPDDYEFGDPEFDNNDITACAVYGYGIKSGKSIEVINDETA